MTTTTEIRQKYLLYLSEQLRDIVMSEGLHLQPHLTLSDLAARFEISRNDMSYLINTYIGKSFIDFINELRINEAIRLIKSNRGKWLKVDELGRQAGFADRTTFCRVCKKLTGASPTELEVQYTDYKL